MGKIINGKEVAIKVKEDIKNFVKEKKEEGKRNPKIASILVGDDGGSVYYMNNQEKVSTSLGVEFKKVVLDKTITEEELINTIEDLNFDKEIDGIILQLPLPKSFNEKKVIKKISPSKDIDCLTFESQGKLYMGEPEFLPCTPNSVVTLLKSLNIPLEGKEVVVLGRSNIVGKPVGADILVVAIGKPKFLDETYVKEGAIVIDVGTSRFEGKITGDVDFDKVIEKASYLTPVPGGVGALTTTLLVKNACEAYKNHEN